ncbi:MAG: hypothetical protein Q7Q71_02550 [Verrucomicrobiota bacterium JB023]|nr:hypothetical protein [Verrucomicrobiota bacterium JB023]
MNESDKKAARSGPSKGGGFRETSLPMPPRGVAGDARRGESWRVTRPGSTPRGEQEGRWLHEFEPPSPGLWRGLAVLGKMGVHFDDPTVSFRSVIDLSSSLLQRSGRFFVPQHSLSIATQEVSGIHAVEPSARDVPALEIDFASRRCRLAMSTLECSDLRVFNNFSCTFGYEMVVETAKRREERKLIEPPMCPCCVERGERRAMRSHFNPITRMLTDALDRRIRLLVGVRRPGASFLSSVLPTRVHIRAGSIIAGGDDAEVTVKARSLHAFVTGRSQVDGVANLDVHLLNTHGEVVATLSAPEKLVAERWEGFLADPRSGYWGSSQGGEGSYSNLEG